MQKRLCCAALLAALLAQSASAFAEPTAPQPSAAAHEPRRDARGIKGISPFSEALKRGDGALLARDLEAAILAYREALEKEPANALGQYRLGEAQLIKGDLHEAELAFSAGLHLSATPALKAKLQFALADLRERQKAYDEASTQWTEYEAFTTEQKLPSSASGTERKRVVLTWRQLSADSLAVKARIEKGLKAADEAVKKSSK